MLHWCTELRPAQVAVRTHIVMPSIVYINILVIATICFYRGVKWTLSCYSIDVRLHSVEMMQQNEHYDW